MNCSEDRTEVLGDGQWDTGERQGPAYTCGQAVRAGSLLLRPRGRRRSYPGRQLITRVIAETHFYVGTGAVLEHIVVLQVVSVVVGAMKIVRIGKGRTYKRSLT